MDVSLSGARLSADGGSRTGRWPLAPLKAILPGDSMLLYREQRYFAILTRSSAQSSFYAPPAPRGARKPQQSQHPRPTQRATETEGEVRLRLHGAARRISVSTGPCYGASPAANQRSAQCRVRGLVSHLSEPTRRPRMSRLGLPPL